MWTQREPNRAHMPRHRCPVSLRVPRSRAAGRDFGLETARLRQRHAAESESGAAQQQLAQLRREVAQTSDALRGAQADAEDMLRGGGAARQALEDAGGRLHALRKLLAELTAQA